MKKAEQVATTMATLSNGVEIGAGIVEKISGNEISNQIDGKPMRSQALADTIATKLQSRLVAYLPR